MVDTELSDGVAIAEVGVLFMERFLFTILTLSAPRFLFGQSGFQSGDSNESVDIAEDPEEAPEIVNSISEAQTERCGIVHISHFTNSKAHSKYLRYGIPVFLLLTTGLLLASDIGSGVVAVYYLYEQDGTLFDSQRLVHVSIFTTVRKLWGTHSYALAIFIACTSVSWPFVKILLSLYAWVTPYTRSRRREILLEVIDVLGKWSFVDIMVFVEILVAFRSTEELPEGSTCKNSSAAWSA